MSKIRNRHADAIHKFVVLRFLFARRFNMINLVAYVGTVASLANSMYFGAVICLAFSFLATKYQLWIEDVFEKNFSEENQ